MKRINVKQTLVPALEGTPANADDHQYDRFTVDLDAYVETETHAAEWAKLNLDSEVINHGNNG